MSMKRESFAKKSPAVRGLAFLLCLSLFAVVSYAWFVIKLDREGTAAFASGGLGLEVTIYDSKMGYEGPVVDASKSFSLEAPGAGDLLFGEEDFVADVMGTKFIRVNNPPQKNSLGVKYDLFLRITNLDSDESLAPFVKFDLSAATTAFSYIGLVAFDGCETNIGDADTLDELQNDGLVALTKETDFALEPGTAAFYRLDYELADGYESGMELRADFFIGAMQRYPLSASLEENLIFVSTGQQLRDAITDEAEGSTIVLLDDINLVSDLTIDKHHNFDFGGHKLTCIGDVFVTVSDPGVYSMDFDFRGGGDIVADSLDFTGVGPGIIVNLNGWDKYPANGTAVLPIGPSIRFIP